LSPFDKFVESVWSHKQIK